jgi:hypothetical protein
MDERIPFREGGVAGRIFSAFFGAGECAFLQGVCRKTSAACGVFVVKLRWNAW